MSKLENALPLYRGIVEDNQDPDMLARVRVRIIGIHSQSDSGQESVRTDQLPWAEVMGSTVFGLSEGIGFTSVIRVGTWVWVLLENNDPSRPIVMGVVLGKGQKGQDTAKVSRGDLSDEVTAGKSSRRNPVVGEQPQTASQYTKSQTLKTESGHMLEFDDTPGNERIQMIDSLGNYIEMRAGAMVEKAIADKLDTVVKNLFQFAGGAIEIEAGGNMLINNDVKIQGKLEVTSDIRSSGADVYDSIGPLSLLRNTYNGHDHPGVGKVNQQDGGRSGPSVTVTRA